MLEGTQLREVLARAEEIHRQSSGGAVQTDIDAILAAAEEAGLPREAVNQALQERFGVAARPPAVGERVFARSTDGKFYLARVVSLDSALAHVRFAQGTDHRIPLSDLRPFSVMPGQKLVCPWPFWGAWTCEVISFNAETDTVRVSDGWGSEQTFPISEVSLPKDKPSGPNELRHRIAVYALTAAASGGAIGAVLTWLLMR